MLHSFYLKNFAALNLQQVAFKMHAETQVGLHHVKCLLFLFIYASKSLL